MYVVRKPSGIQSSDLSGTSFIKVNFEDASGSFMLATQLNRLWRTKPNLSSSDINDVSKLKEFLHEANHAITEVVADGGDWREAITYNTDWTYDTPWRRVVCSSFNHIFRSTGALLKATSPNFVDLDWPDKDYEDSFPVYFSHELGRSFEMSLAFDADVFMFPIYLNSGARIRFEGNDPSDTGVLDEKNRYEIWWIRCGRPSKLVVEGESKEDGCTLAAVMVVGFLTTDHLTKQPGEKNNNKKGGKSNH